MAPGVAKWTSKFTNDRVVAKNYPVRPRTIAVTYGGQSPATAEILMTRWHAGLIHAPADGNARWCP